MAKGKHEEIRIADRVVTVTNPDKVFFPQAGYTKRDLVLYYVAVAEGVLRGVRARPMALKRYPNGIDQPFFFQKRAPEPRPDWIETVELAFPSGRTAQEIVIRDAAQLAWVMNLGCIDLNPHPVRAEDLDHPDELRIDLDPVPGVPWSSVCAVSLVVRDVLAEHGLTGYPKTSGSRGMHVYARIAPRWGFDDVRRAALALAREVERREPALATSRWWKEERHGVFLDYNQNAKDRTTASAYSVRPMPDARVSTPLHWTEVPGSDPGAFTLATVPDRFRAIGDPGEPIDGEAGSLDGLLELAARQERAGLGDAPWPPHYAKASDEPPRVQPSRRRSASASRSGTRRTKAPLLVVARAQRRDDALAGLERWLERHPEVAALLAPEDILVDSMRGRSTTWTRIRINLKNVPEKQRPPSEPPDPDFDPWTAR